MQRSQSFAARRGGTAFINGLLGRENGSGTDIQPIRYHGLAMKTLLLALLLASSASAQVYVNAAAGPGGDGSSWSAAYQDIDSALAVAVPGTRVWVAAGVYRPSVERVAGSPRTASFTPGPGVRLLGGFRGTETTLAERAGLVRQTILDGDIGVPGVSSDNSYNVLRLEGNGARHWVDGFTIRGGNADGTGLERGGGGISSQIGTKYVRNCYFVDNRGTVGGALLTQLSILQIERSTFEGNEALTQGGALFATASCSVTDSLFIGNRAGLRGGAVYANQGLADTGGIPVTRFQNCEFRGNLADRGGAAFVGVLNVTGAAGRAIWSGCTFAGNGAFLEGAAVAAPPQFESNLQIDIVNSILWGNRSVQGSTLSGNLSSFTKVESCIIEGGFPGTNVVSVNPRFVDLAGGDLRLRPGSPAIDAGSNDLVLRDTNDQDKDDDFVEKTPFDRSGASRRQDDPATPDTGQGTGPVTDLGAYEF